MNDLEMKLEHFFIVDNRIKKQLLDLAPNSEYLYEENARIEYYDLLYKGVKDIEIEVLSVLKDLNLEYASDKVLAIFNVVRDNLLKGDESVSKLENLYSVCFSNMNEECINYIKANTSGYSNMNLLDLLSKCTSLNEILHAIHCFIMNNENILQSLPKLNVKTTTNGYPITLYGTKNEISENIFNKFSNNNVGYTDIVSFSKSNKVIMMVRDLGHALCIEIDENLNDVSVRYHIPKLCNIEMINKLKGINKVKEDSQIFSGANGMFVTTKDKLYDELFDFLSMVPTDSDMEIFKNGFNR